MSLGLRSGALSCRLRATVAAFGAAALTACTDRPSVSNPVLPELPNVPPQFRGAAYRFEVNAKQQTVRVIPPTSGTLSAAQSTRADISPAGAAGARYSLLGPDVIDIRVVQGSFVAGPMNNPSPGRRLISFDVIIDNKLTSVHLIAPTFPAPPVGTVGPLLFPFEITVPTTSGSASGGPGSVVVVPPRGGAVAVSAEWNGAPFNFFNDAACAATANDCFRYEEFSTIVAAQSSIARKIGFEIDASVGEFTVNVIAAADLQNANVAANTGTIVGKLAWQRGGGLQDIGVGGANVHTFGGRSTTTDANGNFGFSLIPAGLRTVTVVDGLPPSCTVPAEQTVNLVANGLSRADFTTTCQVPMGTVSGRVISSATGNGFSDLFPILTPNGFNTQIGLRTGAGGSFSFAGVPVLSPTGSIRVNDVPAECLPTPAVSYEGLTGGGTVNVDFVLTCGAPQFYPVTGVWGAIRTDASGRRLVDLTLSIDMGSAPGNIGVNGTAADRFVGIQADLSYASSGLTFLSVEVVNLGVGAAVGSGEPGLTRFAAAITSANNSSLVGIVPFIKLTHIVAPFAPPTVTTTLDVVEAFGGLLGSQGQRDIKRYVVSNIPALDTH